MISHRDRLLKEWDTKMQEPGSQLRLPNFQHDCSMNCVSAETVARMLRGREAPLNFRRVMIIDCRYDYEYLGGHISDEHRPWLSVYHIPPGAGQVLKDILFGDLEAAANDDGSTCIIFHCEFSQSRGPSMMNFIRSSDRELNKTRYPSVFYPEMYLMKGGYNEFFTAEDGAYQDLCSGTYTRMHDDAHVPQLTENNSKRRRSKTMPRRPLDEVANRESSQPVALAQQLVVVGRDH